MDTLVLATPDLPTERSSAKQSPRTRKNFCPQSAAVPSHRGLLWSSHHSRSSRKPEARAAPSEHAQRHRRLCAVSLGSFSALWWTRAVQYASPASKCVANSPFPLSVCILHLAGGPGILPVSSRAGWGRNTSVDCYIRTVPGACVYTRINQVSIPCVP